MLPQFFWAYRSHLRVLCLPSLQGRRTPVSGAKRGRAGGEEIYEYYDGELLQAATMPAASSGAMAHIAGLLMRREHGAPAWPAVCGCCGPPSTHSAVVSADGSNRAAARGLDFGSRGARRRQDTGAGLGLLALGVGTHVCMFHCRQQILVSLTGLPPLPTGLPPLPVLTDEAKGIDALLALAVAGEESLGDGLDSEEEGAPARKKAARRTPQRRRHVAADEDESEEEPADAGAMDDQADEDFAPRQRRTPYSTPAKGRLPRPGSAHATPRRSGSRGGPPGVLPGPSPGLGLRGLSPYMLGERLGEGWVVRKTGNSDRSG